MSELVERLRERAAALSEGPMASTMQKTVEWQAADEIERLTANLAEYEGDIMSLKWAADRVVAAEADRDRLAARVRELEGLTKDLLHVWDPEWEPGKTLRARAVEVLNHDPR